MSLNLSCYESMPPNMYIAVSDETAVCLYLPLIWPLIFSGVNHTCYKKSYTERSFKVTCPSHPPKTYIRCWLTTAEWPKRSLYSDGVNPLYESSLIESWVKSSSELSKNFQEFYSKKESLKQIYQYWTCKDLKIYAFHPCLHIRKTYPYISQMNDPFFEEVGSKVLSQSFIKILKIKYLTIGYLWWQTDVCHWSSPRLFKCTHQIYRDSLRKLGFKLLTLRQEAFPLISRSWSI